MSLNVNSAFGARVGDASPDEETARPRRLLHWVLILPLAFLAMIGGFALSLVDRAHTIRDAVFPVVFGGFTFVWCAVTALTLLRDVLRPGPCLLLDDDGFTDRRTGIALRWKEIGSVERRYSRLDVASLALRTHEPRVIRQNRFRMGFVRERPDELIVPLMLLKPEPSKMAKSFEDHITRAGGTVIRTHRDPIKLQ